MGGGVAEDAEGPEEGAASTDADVHPAAISIALNGASRARADAFLDKQIHLADLQIQNLRKLDAFEASHLRWRRFNDQMKGAVQFILLALGLLIVVALGAALWNAANDGGLVIEAFSVPPDLAARGLTGEVIANKVLDRLSAFQAQTVSMRRSASYANNWGDDIKVQIPDTGVSIGEFNRALHQWLGHETRITGDVYRIAAGIALSARVDDETTPVFKGDEADMDALVDKVAERVYRSTQPYRYASWLSGHGRVRESNAVLQSIVDTGNARERAWAYNGMAHNTIITGDVVRASAFTRKAIESDPRIVLPRTNLAGGEAYLGHDESALAVAKAALKAAEAGDPMMVETFLTQSILIMRLQIAEFAGDELDALDLARKRQAFNDVEGGREDEMVACALLHDLACFRAVAASLSLPTDADALLSQQAQMQHAYAALGLWDAVKKAAPAFHDRLTKNPFMNGVEKLSDAPLRAQAAAHLGETKLAHVLIDGTPTDCVLCLRVRGEIDAIEHNWSGSAYWFTRASAAAPSIPFADSDWGAMLMRKGDLDGAISKFTTANQKGPHFADPLEMWGEALIARNRSDLALAKFEEAAKYAPNWGRLHLKWGEALTYVGREDEARAQFGIAKQLDLSDSDKRELMKRRRGQA